MHKAEKLLTQVLKGRPVSRAPVWLMRQAGRYLPEYRSLRVEADHFIDFCLTPRLAAEATLQPIRRFGFDSAILFADILLISHALGQKVSFESGYGPVLSPVKQGSDLQKLLPFSEALSPVFETIEKVKEDLPDETTLIGFCGGLWTIACYMIQGSGKGGFSEALLKQKEDASFLQALFDVLHRASFSYLAGQIEAGAEVIQIFDSHAGLLSGEAFLKWVVEPTAKLVRALKAEYPLVPVIGFPRQAGPADALVYLEKTGVDSLSLSQEFPLDFALKKLRPLAPLQGNMDPSLLVEGGNRMIQAADDILKKFGSQHSFNLGHGILPHTPPEHVAELVSFVKNFGP